MSSRKKFTPRPNGGGNVSVFPNAVPAPMNVVLRKDAETAARVAYATGRRDAMLTLASEMKVLDGQFIAVTDMIEAIEKAAEEFTVLIQQIESGADQQAETPEQKAAREARERIIVPS